MAVVTITKENFEERSAEVSGQAGPAGFLGNVVPAAWFRDRGRDRKRA